MFAPPIPDPAAGGCLTIADDPISNLLKKVDIELFDTVGEPADQVFIISINGIIVGEYHHTEEL